LSNNESTIYQSLQDKVEVVHRGAFISFSFFYYIMVVLGVQKFLQVILVQFTLSIIPFYFPPQILE
jgi:hypothetical protein